MICVNIELDCYIDFELVCYIANGLVYCIDYDCVYDELICYEYFWTNLVR